MGKINEFCWSLEANIKVECLCFKEKKGFTEGMKILVTGSAGFIGFHLCKKLMENGNEVIGLDNFNSYYDVGLKKARLDELYKISKERNISFELIKEDLENKKAINESFKKYNPQRVVNLAAQAGVRYSIQNPSAYIQSNLVGFGNIIEACRHNDVDHLVYASSSSVYGGNKNLPFSEKDSVDHPVSLYAATKKANELIAHTYSHLYSLPATGLRFFTVYGPWGRPDMALFLFTKAILAKKPIKLFNQGNMIRDFTYIDDIVESLIRIINKPAYPDSTFDAINPNPSTSWAPHRVFNIGNSKPISLREYITALEDALGKKAIEELHDIEPGDVPATAADTSELYNWIKFKPSTSVKEGVEKFVKWYLDFYSNY